MAEQKMAPSQRVAEAVSDLGKGIREIADRHLTIRAEYQPKEGSNLDKFLNKNQISRAEFSGAVAVMNQLRVGESWDDLTRRNPTNVRAFTKVLGADFGGFERPEEFRSDYQGVQRALGMSQGYQDGSPGTASGIRLIRHFTDRGLIEPQ